MMTNEEAANWIALLIETMRKETSGNHPDPEYKDEIYEALKMCITTLKAEPCEDAVSRIGVIELIANYDLSMGQVVKGVWALPTVAPTRAKGEWIKKTENIYYCNQCGRTVHKDSMEDMQIDYPYCHCGAEMETSECRW